MWDRNKSTTVITEMRFLKKMEQITRDLIRNETVKMAGMYS